MSKLFFSETVESYDEVRQELISYFDGPLWASALEDCSFSAPKSNIIEKFMKKFASGMYTPEQFFAANSHVAIVSAFVSSPNMEFLEIAVSMLSKKQSPAVPFLDALVCEHPNLLQDLHPMLRKLNDLEFVYFVNLVILAFLKDPSQQISDFLKHVPVGILISELFNVISQTKMQNKDVFVMLLLDLPKNDLLMIQMNEQMKKALRLKDRNSLIVGLDYLQKGYLQKSFSYSNAFNRIFGNFSSDFFTSILLERAQNTPKAILQIQAELINQNYASPLKKYLMKENSGVLMSDEDISLLAEQFMKKRELPTSILTLNMFNHDYLVTGFASSLQKLAMININARMLLEEMERKKFLMPMKKSQNTKSNNLYLDNEVLLQAIKQLNETDDNMEQCSYQIFNYFHMKLFKDHVDDIKDFISFVNRNFIQKLPLHAIDSFSKTIIDFLCSNLSKQHRISMSILSLRFPIYKYINKIFECNLKREIEILIGLHEAALLSADFLVINNKNKSFSQCETQNEQENVITFDKKLLLRLRWRNLRNDTDNEICYSKEFICLCEPDPSLYLSWESKIDFPSGQERFIILSKLGITNYILFPKLISVLLQEDHISPSLLEILIPLFSNVDSKNIVLPEKINFDTLFKFQGNFIWCDNILLNSQLIKLFQNPPVFVSQSLLNNLSKSEENYNRIFSDYPHAFLAILYNYDELIGKLPSIFEKSNSIINENDTILQNLPRYAMISVLYIMIKNSKNIIILTDRNDSKDFLQICFFFSICFHNFDDGIYLLKKFPFLFQYLITTNTNIRKDENLFVLPNQFFNSLINFAVYCARSDTQFDNYNEWKKFLDIVRISDWPDELTFNHQNYLSFQNYQRKYINI